MPLSAQSENTPSPLTPTATASAAPDGTSSPEQPNCQNALTQAEINACAGQMAKKADQELNAVYQNLRLSLKDSPRSQQLVDAQLAWIQFRDANCAFEKSRYEGGSISPSIFSGCIEQMTQQRIEQLNHYLKSR
ncbi:MAG: lysozyme inhibitor LprI family protein [Thermosynechococcaceae cyanobacterium]